MSDTAAAAHFPPLLTPQHFPSLSDRLYDTAHSDNDTLFDRLCGVVQVLLHRSSRQVQIEALDSLGSLYDPDQLELF
jgi:hypothetical protein